MKKKNLRIMRSLVMVMLLFISLGANSVCAEAKSPENNDGVAKLVVLDPGCQSIENDKKESVGPGAWSWEAENLVGAKGSTTENNEYDLNLKIALKTEAVLKKLGYRVELTRTSNDVDMTNAERSMLANSIDADLYISIHSSADNKKDSGVAIICETSDNPYNYGGYSQCRLLADALRGCLEEKTADANKDVIETDESIGINWCQVPNAIVRVGNIKNDSDDEKLNDSDYQVKLADGIAAGVDSYFAQK